jgi:lysophospholipase L1-like esterase
MPNPYVNKVVQSNGTALIDISDTTAVAADVAEGKYFYLATGEKVEGTNSGGGDEPSEPTYETYFDDSITVGDYGISIASLADLYFAEGEIWRVTWDGVEYLCDTTEYQGWLWTIGNQSLAATDDGVNEPFLLYNYGGGAMNGNARTGGAHTLKLEKQTSSGNGGGSSGGGSTNPLSGKILSTTGDSIAAGAGNNGSGYPELVASDNNMTLQNVAVGGGTVAYINANTFCISRSISSMRTDADFVLLEGGGNDADSGVPLGTLSSGYTATLDDTTFAGAIESMFKAALARFPDKKIGYVFIHKCASLFDSRVSNSYYDMAKSACEKWGIPYLDLNTQVPPLNYIADLRSTYTANGDGYHPNELGYRTFYVPKVTAFLNTMLTDNSLINKIVTANGTYLATDDSADGYSSVTVNVGGTSNIVTGTFKGTTTGAAMDVDLAYTGNGYPIAVLIFPSDADASTFQSTIQRYAVRSYMMDKYDKTSAPVYDGSTAADYAAPVLKYKSSTTNSRSLSNGGAANATTTLYVDESATAEVAKLVKIRSNKKLSVFIASTSYGFMANIEYSYVVIYSS